MRGKQKENVVRRHFKRFDVREMDGCVIASTQARIIDVSVTGLSIETSVQLRIGRIYTLRLGEGNDSLELRGRVRWAQLRSTRSMTSGEVAAVYSSGIALEDVLTSSARNLLEFIERSANVAPGERMFARIKPNPGSTLSVEETIGVQVLQVSRKGLRVESELGIAPGLDCEIELELEGQVFRSHARIVYTEEIEGAQQQARHSMGVQFLDTEPRQQETLKRYIHGELKRRGVGTDIEPTAQERRKHSRPRGPLEELEDEGSMLTGNVRTEVFHSSSCHFAEGPSCLAEFADREQALANGYRPCKNCNP